MLILLFFAFLGGIITILSPCILPVLPIVLLGSLTGGKKRPLGIVTGFIVSFTFFTLFLTSIVRATHIPADGLRFISVMVLAIFGAALIIPSFQKIMEAFFSRISSFAASHSQKPSKEGGFVSGIPIGISLGLLWTPCVGPILASIITLAATSTVTAQAVLITLAYSLGTALPMLAITYGGRQLLTSHPFFIEKSQAIQKAFGIIMLLTALAIFLNIDRKIQAYVLTVFPQYGTGLTKLEDNEIVKKALQSLSHATTQPSNLEDMKGKPMNEVMPTPSNSLPRLGKAPGFSKMSGEWINSQPLKLEELQGKVVLVDFWTYTCINCIRTLPYIRSWYEKYKDKGFVIVGVHTPEFEFEKDVSNVKKAIKDFNLTHPIVQDNAYGIWQDYDNHYWPAKYLVDKDGYIRYTHFGEGEYDTTEKAIQELLSEKGQNVTETIQNPVYQVNAQTPETYLGASRMANIASRETVQPDTLQTFSAPKDLPPNSFALNGQWTIGQERALPKKDALLFLHFKAQNVYLVMRPKDKTKPAQVKVRIGENLAKDSSTNPDSRNGIISVTEDRLYTILKLTKPVDDTVILEFLDDNAELYAFTFG